MTTTTKVIIGVVAAAAIGGGAFWAYKKHPEWFGKGITSNPNQGNPAVAPATQSRLQAQAESAAGVVSAGRSILDSVLG